MMDIERRKEISRQGSHPDTDLQWISPTGEEESLEEFGDAFLEMLEEEPEEDENYRVMDLCCGSGELTRELYERKEELSISGEKIEFVASDIETTPAQVNFQREGILDDIKVLGGDAYDVLDETKKYDSMFIINALTEFQDIEPFAHKLSDSLKSGGSLCFTSTYDVLDVFRALEEESDENYVKEDHEVTGRDYTVVDSVEFPNGLETSFAQFPRPMRDYVSLFESLGFKDVKSGEVKADVSSVPVIARSIDSYEGPTDEEGINKKIPEITYDYRVMELR